MLPKGPIRVFLLLWWLTASAVYATEIIQSPNDPRDYLAFTLDNGLQVLVISDPDTDKAAVSLDVGVGSGDDPEDRQGLAHFLEHMLFLGTERYPEAGEYQAYISNHGGSHNAFTAHERTNYFFDIDSQFLEPGLDRFSRFFIDPLFTPDYVQREKHAVHSEYQSKLKEDSRRGYSAFLQVVNPEHPLSGFAVGSLDTLADRPGADLRDELIRFYQAHYSADNMSLVVLAAEPVQQLKAMVQAKFQAVPQRPVQSAPTRAPLFKPGTLPALLKVKTLKQVHQLNLSFPVPPVYEHFREKPLRYLSALLGHEGPGSLLQVLKERHWAKALSAGPGVNYRDSATLSINIDLTPEGFDHYREVVELSFQYLQRIREAGVQPWIFEEEKTISEMAFRFRENSNRVYQLTHLAANLKRYPLPLVIYGDYLYGRFDPQLIRDYLARLRPDNLLLTLSAPDLDTDRIDPWFQTPYSFEPLPQALLAQWSATTIDPALKIPEPNPFLPQDFSLRAPIDTPKPQVLRDAPGYRLWFKQDRRFLTPKADFFVTFRSPIANDSPRHHVMTELFIELANDALNSYTYPASLAGQESSLYTHIRGFSLRLSGYRDKQERLLDRILQQLTELRVDPQRLAIVKEMLRTELENRRRAKPYNQLLDRIYLEVLKPQWSIDQQLAELENIGAAELQRFIGRLLQAGYVEALANGNLHLDDVWTLSASVERHLLDGTRAQQVAPALATPLPKAQQVIEMAIDHNDSAISFYIQGPDDRLETRACYALLGKILSPPFYTQLRTEKQLGYVVFASPMPILDHPGLGFVIQSPNSDPQRLQTEIETFLAESLPRIESLTPPELEQYKQALLVELLKRAQNLTERTSRYWREIDRDYLNFDSREQLARAIEQVQLSDLVQSYQTLSERQLVARSAGDK